MPALQEPVTGALLAGGAGSRLGGGKPNVELAGRPLAAYPLSALKAACDRVVVVAKPATALDALQGVERWNEPELPRHPLTGIVHALERAAGPLLVCAADMPFVTADACAALIAAAAAPGLDAADATVGQSTQPVFALYLPQALPKLRAAPSDEALRRTLERLVVRRVELDAETLDSVNTPDDLSAAESRLRQPRKRQ